MDHHNGKFLLAFLEFSFVVHKVNVKSTDFSLVMQVSVQEGLLFTPIKFCLPIFHNVLHVFRVNAIFPIDAFKILKKGGFRQSFFEIGENFLGKTHEHSVDRRVFFMICFLTFTPPLMFIQSRCFRNWEQVATDQHGNYSDGNTKNYNENSAERLTTHHCFNKRDYRSHSTASISRMSKGQALTGENLSSTLLLRNENREFVTNQGMSRNSQKGYAKDIKDPLNVGTRFPCTHWALSRGWQRDRNN